MTRRWIERLPLIFLVLLLNILVLVEASPFALFFVLAVYTAMGLSYLAKINWNLD